MEIERIEKVKLTAEEEISLDRVSAIMTDVMRYSEDDDLIEIASDITTGIKKFYVYTYKQ